MGDHTSVLNYQDERQEQLFVDSKDYSKQIDSDDIYSDIHGPKKNVVHIDNKERSQQDHTSILNYQDERQEQLFVDRKDYSKQINSDAIYSDIRAPKTNAVHIDNKERSQQAHTSILNYQDKQQEQLFVDSKDYSKQINSDAIYSDNHGPKTNAVHIDNKERSHQDHTSILNYQDERQEQLFVDSKDYS